SPNSRIQFRRERHPLVEDEARAFETLATHGFEVVQYATVELVHAVDSGLGHVNGRFFAPYAARAERDDGLARQFVAMAGYRFWKLGKSFDAKVERAFEGAGIDFEAIARIQQHDFVAVVVLTISQPALQGFRVDDWGATQFRANRRVIHANDFALDLD